MPTSSTGPLMSRKRSGQPAHPRLIDPDAPWLFDDEQAAVAGMGDVGDLGEGVDLRQRNLGGGLRGVGDRDAQRGRRQPSPSVLKVPSLDTPAP